MRKCRTDSPEESPVFISGLSGLDASFMASPKDPMYVELSRIRNEPGSLSFSISMAWSLLTCGLYQYLVVSCTNFTVGSTSRGISEVLAALENSLVGQSERGRLEVLAEIDCSL